MILPRFLAQRREIRESPGKGLLQRAKGLLFDGGCSCDEGNGRSLLMLLTREQHFVTDTYNMVS